MVWVKIAGLIAYLIIIVGVSLGSMIYGWGLTPENWWWIAGGYVVMLAATTLQAIGQALSD